MPSTTTTTWETIPTNPDIVSKNPVRCANLILPRLYLSDLTTAKDVSIIESLGVTHMISVIDIVPTFPQSMANIQKLFVQSMDIMEDDLLQYMPMTTAFIKAALEENDLNVVLASRFHPTKHLPLTNTINRFIVSKAYRAVQP